ncbi:MAG: 30S ribosomal protein S6 [Melioribacteraceae bacterium]|nr:30S ribosomal protein S6 [Melioribacteraceae bacterium]MCO6474040.1 30S ribosomal protein S6 [Melioribacteraceae bacterium]MDD3557106.1 30S ribosomal protein S6 [Melioribacteraceae bacterium]
MKKNHYECVVIINAALEDDQIEASLSRVSEIITTNGGEIFDLEKWGRKRLAYPIQKSKSGFYAICRYVAPTEAISKIERLLRLDETVVRYLTVTMDKEALEYFEKSKVERETVKTEETETTEQSDETTQEAEPAGSDVIDSNDSDSENN